MADPQDRKAFWNERYTGEGFIFGVDANVFVVEHLADLPPGRALDLGCGQGRNAVWLAARGHDVVGVDLSEVAVEQARSLAAQAGVDAEFVVADLVDYEPGRAAYDLVLLSYLQLEEQRRVVVHSKAAAALSPGGTLFLVGHHADNLARGVGGPQRSDVLFTEDDLAADFASLEIIRNEQVERAVEGHDRVALDVLVVGTSPAG